jgi:hypothetical protein
MNKNTAICRVLFWKSRTQCSKAGKRIRDTGLTGEGYMEGYMGRGGIKTNRRLRNALENAGLG